MTCTPFRLWFSLIRVSPHWSWPHHLIITLWIISAMIRVSPHWSRPRHLIITLWIISAMIRVSPHWSRPRHLIIALLFISAMIRVCSHQSALASWSLSVFSSLGTGHRFHLSSKAACILVEVGGGSNARSVLCLASELYLQVQQVMISINHQKWGQWTPNTSLLWSTLPMMYHPLFWLLTVQGAPVLPTWSLSVSKLPLSPHHP